MVSKKDGTERMCIDYRPINAVTQKDAYPLPRTSEVLDTLGKASEFLWAPECQNAVNDLKLMLTNAPVLQRPDNSLQYILHTDQSPVAIGAALTQIGPDGKEHPIAYGSRMLRAGELKYAPTQGECFSVLHWLRHFRHYLYTVPFILEVDHWALKWMMTTGHSAMLARWAMTLQEFNMGIRHRPG